MDLKGRLAKVEKFVRSTSPTDYPRQIGDMLPWERILYGAFAEMFCQILSKCPDLKPAFLAVLSRLKIPDQPEQISSPLIAQEFLIDGIERDNDDLLPVEIKTRILDVIRDPGKSYEH